MIRRIVVSPEAKDDIVSIFAEGIVQFGIERADSYLEDLQSAIHVELAQHPMLGLARPELGPGIRSLYRGSHHIYYLIESGELRIVRILHQRMNVTLDLLSD